MTTEEKFNAAVNVIRNLPKNGSYQPSNELMLRFYGYFKQATQGPCKISRPPFYDLVGRAKYDAWKKLNNMTKQDAMAKYVEELHNIVETMSYSDNVANFLEAPTDELASLDMNDLELVVGDVMERVRSQPNSPFASREASPIRLKDTISNESINVNDNNMLNESDHSDDEFSDTIEYPEKKFTTNKIITKEHIPRTRTKNLLTTNNNIDISNEISNTIQNLKNDIDKLTNRLTIIEEKTKLQRKNNNLFQYMSLPVLILFITWPFLATILTRRYLIKKK